MTSVVFFILCIHFTKTTFFYILSSGGSDIKTTCPKANKYFNFHLQRRLIY